MAIKAHHIIIGGGLLVGIGLLARLYRNSKHLEFIYNVRLHSIDWKKITVAIDTRIKNPMNGGIRIGFPFLRVRYGESTIASSQSVNERVKIPANGELALRPIMLEIPLLSLIGPAADLIKYFTKKINEISVTVEAITEVDAGLFSIPIQYKQPVKLSRNESN